MFSRFWPFSCLFEIEITFTFLFDSSSRLSLLYSLLLAFAAALLLFDKSELFLLSQRIILSASFLSSKFFFELSESLFEMLINLYLLSQNKYSLIYF
jgi:hypothetical protein